MKMKAQDLPFTIGDRNIQPGERTIVMLPMPKLYDCTPLSIPVHVIRGKKVGPTLCVTAAIHGDEVNGIEIIHRLLKKRIFKKMAGNLIAAPIVNLYGFLYQDRYLMDRRDLNRSFPGRKTGSLAGRLAYLVRKELIAKSTHMIDLHSGSAHRVNLPQIRANFDMPKVKNLASAFNAPIMLHSALRDGSMRQYASDQGIPFLLYEGGEALRFDEQSIRVGLNGILGVMRALKMIDVARLSTAQQFQKVLRVSHWVRASHSGVLRPAFGALGKTINKGDLLATIYNPAGVEEHKLVSPVSGVIIGKNNLPLVHAGAALFHIACL